MKHISSHPGKRRREPKITEFDYLHLSNLAKLLRSKLDNFLSGKDLMILDCGCGNKPYFPFFESISSLYVGVDLRRAKSVDIVCDIEKLPFKAISFDVVLCTQVLEHAISPRTLTDEIHRVLKRGGFLFLSTHGVWPVHGSFDFWRWTNLGLERILAKFSMIKIFECGGNVATFFQIVNLYVPDIRYVRPLIFLFLNKIGEYLDKKFRGRSIDTGLIENYLAVAKK